MPRHSTRGPAPFRCLPVVICLALLLIARTCSAQNLNVSDLMPVLGSANTCIGGDTLMDLLTTTGDLSLVAEWVRVMGYTPMMASPLVLGTLFAPVNEAIRSVLPTYTGKALDIDNQASPSLPVMLYQGLKGLYSQEDLLRAGSVNTVLGLIKTYDMPLRFTKDGKTGKLILSGLDGPPNNAARVLKQLDACNGRLFVTDNLLLPANRTGQIDRNYGDSVIVSKLFLTPFTCLVPLPQALTEFAAAKEAAATWTSNGLKPLLEDSSVSITVLLPTDKALQAVNSRWTPGQSPSNDARVTLYNLLSGAFCPEELVQLGQRETMLGEVESKSLSLSFLRDVTTGETLVDCNDGTKSRIVDQVVQCRYIILVVDALCLPPDLAVASSNAEQYAGLPAALPSTPYRHMVCKSPVYNAAADGPFIVEWAYGTNDINVNLDKGNGDEEGSSNGSNTALILGLAVGLGACILVLSILVFVVYKRRQINVITTNSVSAHDSPASLPTDRFNSIGIGSQVKPILKPGRAQAESHATNGTRISYHGARLESLSLSPPEVEGLSDARTVASSHLPDLGGWELSSADITVDLDKQGSPIALGRGAYGLVYRGMLRGVQPAAIKVMANLGGGAEKAFLKEASILRYINRDRNIVQLYGIAVLPQKSVLVTELMEGGDLRAALSNGEDFLWHRHGKSIALDVARGLTAMHAAKVIHRDLKSVNVLLSSRDSTAVAKIGDVGIAALLTHTHHTPASGVIGTLAWTAPEMIMGKRCTEKLDIYSFGILLWEIATGRMPQRGFTHLPEADERCPQQLVDLIQDCCKMNADERPSAREAYQRILEIPQ